MSNKAILILLDKLKTKCYNQCNTKFTSYRMYLIYLLVKRNVGYILCLYVKVTYYITTKSKKMHALKKQLD